MLRTAQHEAVEAAQRYEAAEAAAVAVAQAAAEAAEDPAGYGPPWAGPCLLTFAYASNSLANAAATCG